MLGFGVLVARAADFKLYPGAKLDEKLTAASNQLARESEMTKNRQSSIYITADPFEKVVAFYKDIARTYEMPGRAKTLRKLPNGQEIKQAFFIFDDASDIATSKLWMSVQHPYIGAGKDFMPNYNDVREVTVISVSQQK
jgi:hypothetical protein